MYRQVLAVRPDQIEALFYLGNLYRERDDLTASEAAFRDALAVNDGIFEIHVNLGSVLEEAGDLAGAETSYLRALEINVGEPVAHFNLGNVVKARGRLEDSAGCFQRVLDLNPDVAEAHSNLGNALQGLGRLEEAAASYRRALALSPNLFEANSNLALTLNMLGALAEALDHFETGFRIKRGPGAEQRWESSFRLTHEAKLTHDIEQFEYLAAAGHEPERFTALAEAYKAVKAVIDWPESRGERIALTDDQLRRLEFTYNRPLWRPEALEIGGAAVSPDLDASIPPPPAARCYSAAALLAAGALIARKLLIWRTANSILRSFSFHG